MFGNENDVRLAVGRAERDVAGMPAHDFDDGDAAMAFRRRADALHAAGGDKHRRGIAGRDVIDDLVQIENRVWTPRACSGNRALAAASLTRTHSSGSLG